MLRDIAAGSPTNEAEVDTLNLVPEKYRGLDRFEARKAVVDAELRRLIQTRELHRLYDKWFTQPIPPQGINLGMRMPHLLVDSLKYPSDYVPQ